MSEIIDFKSAVEKRAVKIEEQPTVIGSDEIDDFVYSMMGDFSDQVFEEFGLDFTLDPSTLYEAFVISESMKAAIYRMLEVDHQFQVVAKDVFESIFPNGNVEDFFPPNED